MQVKRIKYLFIELNGLKNTSKGFKREKLKECEYKSNEGESIVCKKVGSTLMFGFMRS